MLLDLFSIINQEEYFSDRLSDKLIKNTQDEVLRWIVLVDGVMAYERLAMETNEFKEELAWIMADDEEWDFSFLRLCRNFGIDHTSLREYLLRRKTILLPAVSPESKDP